MVFPRNSLAIFNKTKQKEVLLIEFNAFDALRRVDREHLPDVKVILQTANKKATLIKQLKSETNIHTLKFKWVIFKII